MIERDSLRKEIGDSLDSLTHQYKSSIEFTEELRLYIKEHLEKEVIDKENGYKNRVDLEILKLKEVYEPQL